MLRRTKREQPTLQLKRPTRWLVALTKKTNCTNVTPAKKGFSPSLTSVASPPSPLPSDPTTSNSEFIAMSSAFPTNSNSSVANHTHPDGPGKKSSPATAASKSNSSSNSSTGIPSASSNSSSSPSSSSYFTRQATQYFSSRRHHGPGSGGRAAGSSRSHRGQQQHQEQQQQRQHEHPHHHESTGLQQQYHHDQQQHQNQHHHHQLQPHHQQYQQQHYDDVSMVDAVGLAPPLMWEPKGTDQTQMTLFRGYVNQTYNLDLENYEQLYEWSINQISDFWAAVWHFTNIIPSSSSSTSSSPSPSPTLSSNASMTSLHSNTPSSPPLAGHLSKSPPPQHHQQHQGQQMHQQSQKLTKIVDETLAMDDFAEWFPGVELNFAENMMWCRDPAKMAIVETGELRSPMTLSYAELYSQVNRCAQAMKALGITKGDVVAAYIPNCKEAVIGFLAASSIGAIWSSTSPDFGATGVLDRFLQVKPKLLFSVNAVAYNNCCYEHFTKLRRVMGALQCEKVVIIRYMDSLPSMDPELGPTAITWPEFMALGPIIPPKLVFEPLPFNHPLVILYSSGTTGKPKCIVHSAGGLLIQMKKEHGIHGNMSAEDVFYYYTTTGWMMWNWLISGLTVGATIVLYDGSPFKPTGSVLWKLVDDCGITQFGTSAKYLQTLQQTGYSPRDHHSLKSLKTLYSTGSVLPPASYDYVYEHIKADVMLSSITGGTDICSLLCGHNTDLPVYRGEIQCRMLGMAVQAWQGYNQPSPIGSFEPGDLVCTKPFPCMPLYFWNDDQQKSKYRDAYFGIYPHVWCHGDFLSLNAQTHGVTIHGRSDATLNPKGVRFGSAEIYNILERHFGAYVADSICVGQRMEKDNDERVVLFLKLRRPRVVANEQQRLALQQQQQQQQNLAFSAPHALLSLSLSALSSANSSQESLVMPASNGNGNSNTNGNGVPAAATAPVAPPPPGVPTTTGAAIANNHPVTSLASSTVHSRNGSSTPPLLESAPILSWNELLKLIKDKIRAELSPRHVPAVILPIAAIPYTVNGKKVEVLVKKIVSGRPAEASSAIANPETLDLYRNLRELMVV